MTVRVTFISPAIGAALRGARFEDGEPLDAVGRGRAEAAAGSVRADGTVAVSPTARCRETAEALGLTVTTAPGLAGWSMGRWHGLALDEVAAAEPEAVGHWLADPDAAPHGGESLTALCARVAGWLTGLPDGPVLAVAEPELVRAAVVHALGVPAQAFWRIDVPPLTATELTGRSGRWNLRCGRPLT
ncbi:histidine phosphatase family protein [Kitasatospora sp. NPDC002040]|uniref:histidine phosphatase family protein n=1 Tax=Kitasatospora sp. NPDC002040 TaxID=3154661 RepID=UPI003334656A